jgi:hypothetical protein
MFKVLKGTNVSCRLASAMGPVYDMAAVGVPESAGGHVLGGATTKPASARIH